MTDCRRKKPLRRHQEARRPPRPHTAIHLGQPDENSVLHDTNPAGPVTERAIAASSRSLPQHHGGTVLTGWSSSAQYSQPSSVTFLSPCPPRQDAVLPASYHTRSRCDRSEPSLRTTYLTSSFQITEIDGKAIFAPPEQWHRPPISHISEKSHATADDSPQSTPRHLDQAGARSLLPNGLSPPRCPRHPGSAPPRGCGPGPVREWSVPPRRAPERCRPGQRSRAPAGSVARPRSG